MTHHDANVTGGSNGERSRGSGGEGAPGDRRRADASRRDFLRTVGVGAAATVGFAAAASGQTSDPLVVNDFDGDPAWPGTNDLGNYTSAGDLANGSGTVSDGALRLEYDGAGWFVTNVRRAVSAYDRLEFEMRGDDGGEGESIQLEVGGVEDTLANLADGAVTTTFSTIGVDLADAGVDRTSVDDVWLEFFQAGTGAVELREVRFAGEQSMPTGTPGPVGSNAALPGDPDDDGLFEDVNGNGRQDIADAVDLFQNRQDVEPAYFDFNDSGEMEIGDAVALFRENVE